VGDSPVGVDPLEVTQKHNVDSDDCKLQAVSRVARVQLFAAGVVRAAYCSHAILPLMGAAWSAASRGAPGMTEIKVSIGATPFALQRVGPYGAKRIRAATSTQNFARKPNVRIAENADHAKVWAARIFQPQFMLGAPRWRLCGGLVPRGGIVP